MLEEVFLDTLYFDASWTRNLNTVLESTEQEIGCLLWSQDHDDSIHERFLALLLRIGHYRKSLNPKVVLPHKSKFRLPLFSRSDSFKEIEYDIDEAMQRPWSGFTKMEMTMTKETIRITALSKNGGIDKKTPAAPPPPPKKAKQSKSRSDITRIPKVIRLFHSFHSPPQEQVTPRSKAVGIKSRSTIGNPSAVLDELMSKSKHVLKINEEVKKYGDVIQEWAEEIRSISFDSMKEVVQFVEKMDRNMTQILTDETTILKRVKNWPMRYDIMRDAYGRWQKLKSLQMSLLHWKSDVGSSLDDRLQRMRDYIDRVDVRLQSYLRTQSSEEVKFAKHGIPWSSDIFDHIKRASLVVLEQYMNLILQHIDNESYSISRRKYLVSNCACFAFKVHQMVGGFNDPCTEAFTKIEAVAQRVIADWKGLSQEAKSNTLSSSSKVQPRRRVFPPTPPPCNVANC